VVPAAQRPPLVRSAAFNLAQVFNKLKDYQRALTMVELGLAGSPTNVGRAIALAAKGEALCGLQRDMEGQAAFAEAVRAHPVIGRLNAADSMTRLGSAAYWRVADEWVSTVLSSFGHLLDHRLRTEATTIRREIARLMLPQQEANTAGERGRTEPVSPEASAPRVAEAQAYLRQALDAARQAVTLPEAIDYLEKAMTLDASLRPTYTRLLSQWKSGVVL